MWITLGWYPPNWWNNIHTGCRANEMERILYRSFSISSVHSLSSRHSIGSYVYDGVYALALAINNTITDKGINNLTHHVSQALISVEFDGLTVSILCYTCACRYIHILLSSSVLLYNCVLMCISACNE